MSSRIDQNLVLMEGRAITSSTVLSDTFQARTGGSLVTGSQGIGTLDDLAVMIRVGTAFAGGTNVTFNLLGGDAIDGSNDITSATTVATSGAILTAALTANTYVATLRLPKTVASRFRYFQVQGVPSGTHTAGNVDAFITFEPVGANTPVFPSAI